MHSPGHRANILDRRFADIGIGVATGAPIARGGERGGTYVTDFGARSATDGGRAGRGRMADVQPLRALHYDLGRGRRPRSASPRRPTT